MLPKKAKTAVSIKAQPSKTKVAPTRDLRKVVQDEVPEKARRVGLSLKQLLTATPAYFKNRAVDREVNASRYNPEARTKGGFPAISAVMSSNDVRRPTKHKCTIVGLDKDELKIHKQERVVVQCDCESYIYTWEYANFQKGCGRIKYSNGQPARVTNPTNRPGLCIHLVALARHVIRNKD